MYKWLHYLIIAFTLTLLCACSLSNSASVSNKNVMSGSDKKIAYRVAVDRAEAARILFSMRLPEQQNGVKLFSRAEGMGLKTQIDEIFCDGVLLSRISKSSWVTPPGCAEVSWQVSAAEFNPDTVNLSDQQTVSMGGWVLISGPSSLLRVTNNETPAPLLTLVAADGTVTDSTLPNLREPPAFIVLGEAPTVNVGSKNTSLEYIANDLNAVMQYVDPERHVAALTYFRSILGEHAKNDPSVRVVWFEIPSERQFLSGAAGFDTLLANFIQSPDEGYPHHAYRPFVLVLHEQFHQIQDNAARNKPLPTWLGESLAQYYALKGAKRTFPHHEAIQLIWQEETSPQTEIEIGLLKVERMIKTQGDRREYSRFYTQGVWFWAEIDKQLYVATNGEADLDDILSDILALEFKSPFLLPGNFRGLFAPVNGEELDRLIDLYLIGQPAR